MPQPETATQKDTTAPISALRKPTREKSRETVLKQTMRRINKDLEKLDKLVAEFEELKKAHASSEQDRIGLQKELERTKVELIKILGLS